MEERPDEELLSRYFSMMGKKGAKSRNTRLSAERRKEIATKASEAAAKVRSKKAAERRKAKKS